MKKNILWLIVLGAVIFSFNSCERNEIIDPDFTGLSGFHFILSGSASPSVMLVGENRDSTELTVKLTDGSGNPVAYKRIFFEIGDYSLTYRKDLGMFEDSLEPTTIIQTNSSGLIKVKYYGPDINDTYRNSYIFVFITLLDYDYDPIHAAGVYDAIPIRLIYE